MSEIPLRDALKQFAVNWQDDFRNGWKNVFDKITLDIDGVATDLKLREGESIFPARKDNPNGNAPLGAHVFKAFDQLQPEDVRAVIIGQDPYPRVSRATGRAFEQGDLKDWSKGVTTSMKSLLLTCAAQRSGEDKFFLQSAWPSLQGDLQNGTVTLPSSPAALFNAWENQGVLLLNAGLTLSHFVAGGSPEQQAHIRFWSPLVKRVIEYLVDRKNKRVVFLAWGQFSAKQVVNSGVTKSPAWNVRAGMSQHPHPAASTYWMPPNPLAKANDLLKSLGGGAIDW